jgi:hemerythrin-like metal-binding protein
MKIPFDPIAWSDLMVTGVEKIDDQHRYLVATLRQANVKVLDDRGGTQLGEVAKDLLTYAIMHFETEEELMKRHGYAQASPELAQLHIAQHRDFSSRIVAVIDNLREGREVSRIEVLKYLNDWLRDHVLGIDLQLGQFVCEAVARQDSERSG